MTSTPSRSKTSTHECLHLPLSPCHRNNAYQSARQTELDVVRRKGLAKMFNRHFTYASEAIERERRDTNMVLAEILRRKEDLAKNPCSFEFERENCGGKEVSLTQLDKLHLEIQGRKIDVQRKERETMELYRRYVNRYGDGISSSSVSSPSLVLGGATTSKGGVGVMPSVCELPALDEDIVHPSDLSKSHMMATHELKTNLGGIEVENVTKRSQGGEIYSSSRVHVDVGVPNRGLSITNGGISTPQSEDVSNTKIPPPNSKINSHSKHDLLPLSPLMNCSIRDGHSHNPSAPGSVSNYPADDKSNLETIGGNYPEVTFREHHPRGNPPRSRCLEEEEDSVMSGLTSIDMDTMAGAEWKLTEFLRIETDNIRRMLSSDGSSKDNVASGGKMSLGSSRNDMGEDVGPGNDVSSYSSCYDTTRAVAVGKLAQKMSKVSASMMETSALLDYSDDDNDDSSSFNIKKNKKEYEWTAHWSTAQGMEYYHNVITNETCWARPRGVEVDVSILPTSKQAALNNVNDENRVLVKDYTKVDRFEKSNPIMDEMSENIAMMNAFRPDRNLNSHSVISYHEGASVASGGSSKVREYMRRRARRRKKMIIRLFVVAVGFASLGKLTYERRMIWMPLVGTDTAMSIWLKTEVDATNKREEAEKAGDELNTALMTEEEPKMADTIFSNKGEVMRYEKKKHGREWYKGSIKPEDEGKKTEVKASINREDTRKENEKELKEKDVAVIITKKECKTSDADTAIRNARSESEKAMQITEEKKRQQQKKSKQGLATEMDNNELLVFGENLDKTHVCTMPLLRIVSKRCRQLAKKRKEFKVDSKQPQRMEAVENRQAFELKFKIPKACNLPYASIILKMCRKAATKKPIFDLKTFIHSVMQ